MKSFYKIALNYIPKTDLVKMLSDTFILSGTETGVVVIAGGYVWEHCEILDHLSLSWMLGMLVAGQASRCLHLLFVDSQFFHTSLSLKLDRSEQAYHNPQGFKKGHDCLLIDLFIYLQCLLGY